MSNVLTGKEINIKNLDLPKVITENAILYFKYAPLQQTYEDFFDFLKTCW